MVANLFINLLKLISLPLIFLSIVSTIGGMKNIQTARSLGGKFLSYTLLTTVVAASVALILYVIVDPASHANLDHFVGADHSVASGNLKKGSYWNFLLASIPSNPIDPFTESNVLGVLFLALLISAALIALPDTKKSVVNEFFSGLLAVVLKIASYIMLLMPLAVFSFMILFLKDMRTGLNLESLLLYVLCIVSANLFQAIVILPSILMTKGFNPWKLLKAMWPALTTAFFSKSSAATLPMAIKCAEENAGMKKEVTRVGFPMCTTINMNACAAFILTTVLFVSSVHGYQFSNWELVSWIFIASIAAIGNAAVPMGCYFLASSFLASQSIPLQIMGAILPFYTILDML